MFVASSMLKPVAGLSCFGETGCVMQQLQLCRTVFTCGTHEVMFTCVTHKLVFTWITHKIIFTCGTHEVMFTCVTSLYSHAPLLSDLRNRTNRTFLAIGCSGCRMSKFDPRIGYADWGFSLRSSVPPDEFWGLYLKLGEERFQVCRWPCTSH